MKTVYTTLFILVSLFFANSDILAQGEPARQESNIDQVYQKYKVDPLTAHKDGIFFVDYSQLAQVFSYYVIAHYYKNYQISWYDVE